MTTFLLTAVLAWSLAVLMHWWPRLAGVWRRRISVATNAAGIAFLVAALQAEGRRESAMTSLVVVGPTTLTATASASAGLYYYVLTAFCLLLGFAGLVFGESLSRWLAPRPLLSSTLVAWLVTAVRFLLEKSAAPDPLVQAMGVTWLAPVAGAFIATGMGRPRWKELVSPLLAYAFLVRGLVAAVSVAATRLGSGTHYDVSAITSVPVALAGATYAFEPGSGTQVFWLVLVPQLVVWTAFTVLAGMAGAALVRLGRRRGSARVPATPPDVGPLSA